MISIKGYEGYYSVSEAGEVVSEDRWVAKGRGMGFLKGKLMTLHDDCDGYKVVHLYKCGSCKVFRVHRLVALAYLDNPENKPEVNHFDKDKTNNNDWNLEWVTHQENIDHKVTY